MHPKNILIDQNVIFIYYNNNYNNKGNIKIADYGIYYLFSNYLNDKFPFIIG